MHYCRVSKTYPKLQGEQYLVKCQAGILCDPVLVAGFPVEMCQKCNKYQ